MIYLDNVNVYIIYIYIVIKTACGGSVDKASSRTRIRTSSGPLINFIKWDLKYYLEMILYNFVKMIG